MRSQCENIVKFLTIIMTFVICVWSQSTSDGLTNDKISQPQHIPNTILSSNDMSRSQRIVQLTADRKYSQSELLELEEDADAEPPPPTQLTKAVQKLKVLPRSKRQVNFNMKYVNHPSREADQHDVYCNENYWTGEKAENPLLCYQCESSSKDKDPRCDNVIWKFLRPSERYTMRVRCPENRGHFCVKSVKRKSLSGERTTIRGCHGPGPIKTKVDGKHIPLKEGCITYYEADALTTTCFCAKDICNSAPILLSPLTSFIVIVLFVINHI